MKKLSDLDLVLQNPDGFVYIVENDNELNWKNTCVVSLENIPSQYLPNAAVLYDPADFEPYTEQLRSYLDLHFSRQNRLYKLPATGPIAAVAEPQAKEPYRTKKGD